MDKNEKKILNEFIFPEFMESFVCIGSDCPDTCCTNWDINIEKKTFLKYKKYNGDNKELKLLFNKNISRNRNENSITKYGKIKMNDNKRCPFLDENKLCKIHRYIGEDYLSNICKLYPRIYNKISNVIEYSATLSCPKIANLALLDKDGIKYKSKFMEKPLKNFLYSNVMYDESKKYNEMIKYIFDIQIMAISILQYREISLEKRIMIIGSLSKAISEFFYKKIGNIEDIILKYSDYEYLKSYSESLSNIKPVYKSQFEILLQWSKLTLSNRTNNKYDDYLSMALNNIYKSKCNEDCDKNIYYYEKEGIPKYIEFMKTKSYILENYLVHILFQFRYPLNNDSDNNKRNDIFLSYINLVIRFVILRTTMIGLLMNDKDITDEMLVEIIQTFSKRIDHNVFLMENLVEEAKSYGWYSYGGSILVLNI